MKKWPQRAPRAFSIEFEERFNKNTNKCNVIDPICSRNIFYRFLIEVEWWSLKALNQRATRACPIHVHKDLRSAMELTQGTPDTRAIVFERK